MSFYFKTKAMAVCRVSTKGRQEISAGPPELRAVCIVREIKWRKELFPLKFTVVRAKLSRNDSSAAPRKASGEILQAWEIKEQLCKLRSNPFAQPPFHFPNLRSDGKGMKNGGQKGVLGEERCR